MDTAWIYNTCHRADDRSSEGEKTKKAGLSSPVTLVCLTWFWHLLKKKRESQYQQVRWPQKPVFFRPLLDHTCKSWVSSEDRWWHIMFVSGRQLEVWIIWRTTLTSPSLQLQPSLCVLPLNLPLFSISSQARLLSSLARTLWCNRRVRDTHRMFFIHLCWNCLKVPFFYEPFDVQKAFWVTFITL